jgi:hypothetical protein
MHVTEQLHRLKCTVFWCFIYLAFSQTSCLSSHCLSEAQTPGQMMVSKDSKVAGDQKLTNHKHSEAVQKQFEMVTCFLTLCTTLVRWIITSLKKVAADLQLHDCTGIYEYAIVPSLIFHSMNNKPICHPDPRWSMWSKMAVSTTSCVE